MRFSEFNYDSEASRPVLPFDDEAIEKAEAVGEHLAREKAAAKHLRRTRITALINQVRTSMKDEDDSTGTDGTDGDDIFEHAIAAVEAAVEKNLDDSHLQPSTIKVELFNPEQANQQLNGFPASAENDLEEWLRQLRKPGAEWAELRGANAGYVDDIQALRAHFPNLEAVCDVVLGAAVLSVQTGEPLKLPNLLIDGAPGCGKTEFIRHVAVLLDLPLISIPLGSLDGRFELAGGHRSYRGAEPSLLTKALCEHRVANAIVMFDEAELAKPELYQPLYAFIEDKVFRDHFLQIDFNVEHVSVVFITNDRALLPSAIRSRLAEFVVSEPSHTQKEHIVERIYSSLRKQNAYFQLFPEVLPNDCREKLSALSLRQARIALEVAMLTSAARRNSDEAWRIDPELIFVPVNDGRPMGFIH